MYYMIYVQVIYWINLKLESYIKKITCACLDNVTFREHQHNFTFRIYKHEFKPFKAYREIIQCQCLFLRIPLSNTPEI